MTVKELQKYLKNKPADAECYFSIWTIHGEKMYKTQLHVKEKCRNLSENKKHLRITWIDDCRMNILTEKEIND